METTTENAAVYVGMDTYMESYPEDGLYESDIECADCGSHIGAWQHDTEDSTVELFYSYWMCDEDNNYNLCDDCYKVWTSTSS